MAYTATPRELAANAAELFDMITRGLIKIEINQRYRAEGCGARASRSRGAHDDGLDRAGRLRGDRVLATKAKKAAKPRKPVQVYFWPTPNGYKISIMLEECGLPYDVKLVDINKGDQFKPEFLAISPNNKMPAIVDPDGPGGKPISVFEFGAILQYLGRKTGKLYPTDERRRVEVEQWLFWQVGGLGPMAGQAHHFRNYAPEKIPYGIERYTNEVNRLYGVLDARLEDRDYLAGEYSIADIAIYPWARLWKNQGQDIAEFPNVAAWLERIGARKAVQRGLAVGKAEAARSNLATDKEAQKVLFGQTARPRKS